MCQIFNKNDYGTGFTTIPSFNSNTTYTQLIWTISVLLTRIKKYGCSQTNVLRNSNIWVKSVSSILVAEQARRIHLNMLEKYVIYLRNWIEALMIHVNFVISENYSMITMVFYLLKNSTR